MEHHRWQRQNKEFNETIISRRIQPGERTGISKFFLHIHYCMQHPIVR